MSGFTKLHSSIVASTIWRAPDHVRIVWITMLAMADQHGEVAASVPGLAAMANETVEACESALEALMAPDKYSRTPDHEGRRIEPCEGGWRLLNYGKYRQLGSMEAKLAKDAERKRRARAASADASANVRKRPHAAPESCQAEADAKANAERTSDARERPAVVTQDGSPDETTCPSDLERRLTDLGFVPSLAERLGVPQAVIVHELREFVGYWTIGAGASQRRSHWPKKAREHIRKRVQSGAATPPGALEHRRQTGRGEDDRAQTTPSVYAAEERAALDRLLRSGALR